jgi:hypothetical protein
MHDGCMKSAQTDTDHCIAHGGGNRCMHDGCSKSAQTDTDHCVAHGGGRRCQEEGCPKSALGGEKPYCSADGGGPRCQGQGCGRPARLPLQQRPLCRLCETAEAAARYHARWPRDHVFVGDAAARRAAEAAAEAAEEP